MSSRLELIESQQESMRGLGFRGTGGLGFENDKSRVGSRSRQSNPAFNPKT